MLNASCARDGCAGSLVAASCCSNYQPSVNCELDFVIRELRGILAGRRSFVGFLEFAGIESRDDGKTWTAV